MLTGKTFKCDRTCADCCKYLTVKLDNNDIKRIKKAGYDEDFFMSVRGHFAGYFVVRIILNI